MKDDLHQMCTALQLSAHTLSFVSTLHTCPLLSVERDTYHHYDLFSFDIQFAPLNKFIRFLYLSFVYTAVNTQAKQTCPNRRRLPNYKGGTNRRPLIFFHRVVEC